MLSTMLSMVVNDYKLATIIGPGAFMARFEICCNYLTINEKLGALVSIDL